MPAPIDVHPHPQIRPRRESPDVLAHTTPTFVNTLSILGNLDLGNLGGPKSDKT